MCGIAGYLSLNGQRQTPDLIKKMTSALRHRGPDDEGSWTGEGISLGHTRLKIIDMSQRAAQPMCSSDGRYRLTYNGEIYNYLEIKKELKSLGYEFYSSGDTEVLLNALIQWGEKIIPRLNGMFAFGFWDDKEKKILLARDRYGIKPLYIGSKNGIFVFGSEIKALIIHPEFGAKVDYQGLLEYFTFQNFFSSHTLFRNIESFPAGHFMKINLSDGSPRWCQYWDFHFFEPESPVEEKAYSEELNRLFKQAVRRQMMGDVEVGGYLSSGIDSGAIAAVASGVVSDFKTFTCGFDMNSVSKPELDFDERIQAESIASQLGSKNYQIQLKSSDMESCLSSLVYALDEPRVGQSYPNFYAAKLARRHVQVVLSGTGGDELFAGYPWRYYRTLHCNSFDHYVDQYYLFWQRLIPNQTIRKAFQPVWKHVKNVWTRDIFHDVLKPHAKEICRPEEYINLSLYMEAKTFLHGLLIVEDKLSMAHGLESRVPFLDNDLVDFAMGVPLCHKLGNLAQVIRMNENEPGPKVEKYFQKTRDGKLILRQVMEQYISKKNAYAVKQGFSGPDASWFRNGSMGFVEKKIGKPDADIYNFLDYGIIRQLMVEHFKGRANRRLLIWSLLCFEEWCNRFLY